MTGPGPRLVEARYNARTRFQELMNLAKEVSDELEQLHEENKSKTMDFYYAKTLADSAWRAAGHGAGIFN